MESENQREAHGTIESVGERNNLTWTPEALEGLRSIPDGFMREMTQKRVEAFAKRKGYLTITPEVVQEKYADWGMKSDGKERSLEWSEGAKDRIMKIPVFIRETVATAIEGYAKTKGVHLVTEEIMEEVKGEWGITTAFHPR